MLTEIGLGLVCQRDVLRLGEDAADGGAAARILAAAGVEETWCRLRLSADGRLVPVTDGQIAELRLAKRKKDVEDEEEMDDEEEEEDDLEEDEDEDFDDEDEEDEDEFEEEFDDDELDEDDDDNIFYDDDDDE
ncbi:MAG TPA: hypothetical protein VHQ47_17230 [Phycisphaerae bacterium]|jgi:hypothetical protein|nr:hypothetical protein [Phycisphaerae bacterium]